MRNESKQILDYLTERGKSISADGIANFFKFDKSLVEKILSELEMEHKVEKRGNKYAATNILTGFVSISNTGKLYVKYDNKRILCSNSSGVEINEGDSVEFKITDRTKNNITGEIVNVTDKRTKKDIGTVIMREGETVIRSDKAKIYIYPNSDVLSGDIVKYKLGDRINDSFYEGEVLEVLGRVDEPKSDMISILGANGFSTKFPEEVLEEAKKINQNQAISLENRRDLRNELIFTIDGDDTKDIDDAISLDRLADGTYKLGVHIADVSHFVPYGSAIDREAYARGTSVYPPSSVVPMLPPELSCGVCSLFENTDRYTLSCEMYFDKEGNLITYDVFPSVINSAKKMTYSNVNRLLDIGAPFGYEKFESELKLMNEFKDVLRKKRFRNNSINFEVAKVGIKLNQLGTPIKLYTEHRGEAEKLIEDFMLGANTATADLVDIEYGGNGVFRNHDNPDEIKLRETLVKLKRLGIKIPKGEITSNEFIVQLIRNIDASQYKELATELVLKSMSRAMYARTNTGHFGLNFKRYAHFTSPIRRYADLTLHRLIKEVLNIAKQNLPEDLKDHLNKTCSHISSQERAADAAEAEITKMKMAEFLQDEVGKDYEGQVVEVFKNAVSVKLSNGITGTIDLGEGKDFDNFSVRANGKTYRLGQMLNVTIESISIYPAVISLVDADVISIGKSRKFKR